MLKLRQATLAFCILATCLPLPAQDKPAPAPEVVLAREGKSLVDIFVLTDKKEPGPEPAKKGKGAKKKDRARSAFEKATADLGSHLQAITGAEFPLHLRDSKALSRKQPGIYIGKAADFPWLDAPRNLGPEEFVVRTAGPSQLYLIADSEAGRSDAIYALLEKLGCRWYFPGATWTVIPRQPTLRIALNIRQKPDVSLQRKLAMGWGLHSPVLVRDYDDWTRRNRLPGTLQVYNSHTWPGISPDRDFAAHPEWFALVKGERKPSKPCYSHPEVIARGVAQSLAYLEKNPEAQMVSVSAPDGAGFCECELCRKRARVEKIYPAHGPGGLFGRTAEGQEVAIASETIFHYANETAAAVARKYPGKFVGTIAYSAYAHPPSFDLLPNVYVEITKGYRRTPLTLPEQIVAFAHKARHLGVYEYYDVEQWSWDQPGKARASQLDYHSATIPYFVANKIHSIKGEISNNWGPNGLGYYVLAKVMWDSSTDVRAVEAEFYRTAFGPAAEPLQRFYRRWESGQEVNARTLGLAYRDLQAAVDRTAGQPAYRARVDHVRLYLHFLKASLFLHDFPLLVWGEGLKREHLDKLIKRHGEAGLKRQVDHLGDYVHRLMETHMVHSFAYNSYLKSVGKLLGCDTSRWQKPGTTPTADEIDRLFQEDLKDLGAVAPKDVEPKRFSRQLVPLVQTRPELVKGADRKIACGPFVKGSLYVLARQDDMVAVAFAPARGKKESLFELAFVPVESFAKDRADLEEERLPVPKLEEGTLRFKAEKTGYYRIQWTEASITAVSHPAVLPGTRDLAPRGATLYFFVPRGTLSFLLRTNLQAGPLRVQDGQGKIVVEVERKKGPSVDGREIVIDVPEGREGVWSIWRPQDRQDQTFFQLVGVPGYLSLLPDQLLVPQEVAR